MITRPGSNREVNALRKVYVALVLVAVCMVVSGCGFQIRKVPLEDRPSIIFIIADDLDAKSISHMPQLKSLLINKGIIFENAFVTNPLCCPARATVLRGQYSHNHGVLTNN